MACFNPRPREGATDCIQVNQALVAVSIHAPVKGRPLSTRNHVIVNEFQSTPP